MKFISVGLMNSILDLAVFNYLIFSFGLLGRYDYILFKSISFLIAVINSYVWNKAWVFETSNANSSRVIHYEFGLFLGISIINLILNTVISFLVFSAGSSVWPNLTINIWANIGVLSGSAVVWVLNFLGYKFLVFKK